MPELLLASSSPYRRELLTRLGVPFRSLAPEIDERPLPNEKGRELAARLAMEKTAAVARQYPAAVTIGSDQVAMLGEQLLGKPGESARAREQLSAASGRTVIFYTAVCVHSGDSVRSHVDETQVTFRSLGAAEIDSYLDKEQPYDCAGSFKVEGLGVVLFERVVSTDPTALQGLPLIWLARELLRVGIPLI